MNQRIRRMDPRTSRRACGSVYGADRVGSELDIWHICLRNVQDSPKCSNIARDAPTE